MSKIAYIRVSTSEQSVENQRIKMKNLGIEKYFKDEGISGTIKDRAGLREMLDFIRENDIIYVVSLDRLSRNYSDLEQIQAEIKVKKAILLPLDILEKLGLKELPNDSISKLIFDIISTVSNFTAENERVKMLERQKLGIERARKEGKYLGTKPRYTKSAKGRNKIVYQQVFLMLAEGKSIKNIADTLNISRNTIYSMRNNMNEYINQHNNYTDKDLAKMLEINQKYIEKVRKSEVAK